MRIVIHSDDSVMIEIEERNSAIHIRVERKGTHRGRDILETTIDSWGAYPRFELLHAEALAIIAGFRPQLDKWAERK